jgi:hypothetical protein
MRKGEQFVLGEVRARARERVRWSVSLGLLALALAFARFVGDTFGRLEWVLVVVKTPWQKH